MKRKPAPTAQGGGSGKGPEDEDKSGVIAMLSQPKMIAQLRNALPRHVTPERLTRIVLTNLRMTPDLQRCTQASLLGAIMQAAQLGLEPGVLGQCYLVPYRRRFRDPRTDTWQEEMLAQLIIGYRGMAQLAWRSALVRSIAARAVYEGDFFLFDYGEDTLQHRPNDEDDPDKITHVYAVVNTTSGGRLWDVMTRAAVEKVRGRSAAAASGKKGPWDSDYAEMAKKTVLRRLFKLAPQSAEMQTALGLEDQADTGDKQTFEIDIPMDEYTVDRAPAAGPTPTAPDDVPTRMQLDVTINERAEEFTNPERARGQIIAVLEREFGPLRELAGEKLREALAEASIVKVDVS